MIFSISDKDYSDHVIAGTYKINTRTEYDEFLDAAKIKHKRILREKAAGSFNMFFRTEEEYLAFKNTLDQAKSSEETYPVSVTVNDTGEQRECNAFIDYELTRNRDASWRDYFEVFTVNLEEE